MISFTVREKIGEVSSELEFEGTVEDGLAVLLMWKERDRKVLPASPEFEPLRRFPDKGFTWPHGHSRVGDGI